MADIDWSTEPKVIIPFGLSQQSVMLIASWPVITQIEPLVRFTQVDVVRTAYPYVTFIVVKSTLLGHLEHSGPVAQGTPEIIPFDKFTVFGIPILPIQVVPYGYGCPKWQYWG